MAFFPLRELGLFASSAGILGALWAAGWIPAAPAPASLLGTARLAVVAPDTVISFADDILPILQQRCAECHGGKDESGGVITEAYLNLLSYEGVMAGSEFGTHTVGVDAPAETLTLSHSARSRAAFAEGALTAAQWLHGRKGLYSFDQFAADFLNPLFDLEVSP